jgi:hypothetical protein
MQTSTTSRPARRSSARAGVGLLVGAALVLGAGCSTPAASVRPTEPRAIVVDAIRTTAALPGARIHIEAVVGMGAQQAGEIRLSLDADVNLVSRELAGRTTTTFPQELMGGMGPAAQQTVEFIVMRDGVFGRDPGTGRWTQASTEGLPATPTTADLVAILEGIVGLPAMAFEGGATTDCSLGACDHVTVHVDGAALAGALGRLMNREPDDVLGVDLPDFDLELLVDRSTSVLSELSGAATIQGTTIRLLARLTNAGEPIRIVPPPAALIDGGGIPGIDGGGFGPAPTPIMTILPQVPSDTDSPTPDLPAESP